MVWSEEVFFSRLFFACKNEGSAKVRQWCKKGVLLLFLCSFLGSSLGRSSALSRSGDVSTMYLCPKEVPWARRPTTEERRDGSF